MSITDELREYAHDCCARVDDAIHAIADRIDAEHEQQMAERRRGCVFYDAERNYCKVHDEGDMAELGYVRLPVDADGVPIHVGDVMEPKGSDFLFGETSFEVRSMRCDECGWEVYDRLGDRYAPSLLRHHHAPTVEDVLTEFGIDWEHESDCEDRAALLKEYAAKLKLAEGEDA